MASASPSTASQSTVSPPPPPPPTQPPQHPSPPSLNPSPQPSNDPPIATALPLLMPAPVASSRRLPPPCWTPEETSALIDAYRDKWYALRRGNLRAAHWQEVADDVHRRCPAANPPKTAVQCRHKMEKLRKRYRAELQRARSIPHHRFSSSWVYFSKMDAMEKGPNASPSAVSLSSPHVATVVAAVATPVAENFNDVGDEDEADEDEDDGDEDYAAYKSSYDPRRDFNREYNRNGLRIKIPGNSNSTSGSGFRSMKRNFGDYDENPNPSYGYKQKYGNINNFSSPSPPQFDEGMRYATRVVTNGGNNGSAGSSGMNSLNVNSMMMMKNKKKKTGLGKRDKEEREDDAAMEMVEAIRMLGEGFVRMEKMKMEMMRETERMRMEMEMKRTEMILESQHRIVEAFAKGWAESMKSKKDASS